MRVMVTGCAGFLGSHLANYHLDRGDRVIGIDDFSSSKRDSKHITDLTNRRPSFRFIEANICDVDFFGHRHGLEKVWPQEQPELIYNFGCPASPPVYQSMPIKTMLTCVQGTNKVLQYAHAVGARVVHASTSEVYGDPDVTPQNESYRGSVNSYGPRSCYDEGKRSAEALCYDYLNKHDVDVRLVRIFNTYGVHMDANDGRVISNFICQALRGEKITVYGNGEQTRSFCYVDDLIRGITALGNLETNPKTPINLGNPNEFTVKELAHRVINKVYGGNKLSLELDNMVEMKPLPIDDPTQRRPDITLAKSLLKWEPTISLDEGLDKTIEHFRRVLKQ